MMSGKIHRKGI